MDAFEKLLVLIFVLQAVYNLYERLMGKRRGDEAPPDDHPVPDDAPPDAELERRLDANVAELAERAEGLGGRLRDLETTLASARGPAGIVRELVAEELRPEVDGIASRVQRLQGVQDPGRRLDQLRDGLRAASMAELRLGFAEDLARWRADPDLGAYLADADAMAVALLRPLQQFSNTHGLRFPPLRPVCVPAAPGMEAVVYDLFPGRPVLFVPDDLVEDIMRWPSLAHEVGHLMWRFQPGFARDVRALVPGSGHPWLPHLSGRQVVFDVQACFGAWLHELVADAFCAMLMGPAALRGMVHAFAPEDPTDAVLVRRGGDGNTIGEHPPAHLRVTLMAHLLDRMDYPTTELEPLLSAWNRAAEAPTHLLFPTLEGPVLPLPLPRFSALGRALLDAFFANEYSSLSGYTLRAIHDLELGPGRWARAKTRARQLLADEPFHDDPTVVLVAGIEAAERAPGSSVRIAKGVRRAIIGLGTDDRPPEDQAYALTRPSAPYVPGAVRPSDVVDALLLRSVLHRPHKHPLEPGWHAPWRL